MKKFLVDTSAHFAVGLAVVLPVVWSAGHVSSLACIFSGAVIGYLAEAKERSDHGKVRLQDIMDGNPWDVAGYITGAIVAGLLANIGGPV